MKALICGVSGQDGAYLSRLLLDKGYEVIGTSRDAQMSGFYNLEKLGIKNLVSLKSMAINDFRSVLQVITKVRPDEIYNLAGQSSVGLSFDQPVETMESIALGTLNLLEAIRFSGIPTKFYNAGSSECFGESEGIGASEDHKFKPKSPYAVAKSTAFWEVANYRESYDLFASTGVLFNHESPLRPPRFVTRKIIRSACRISDGKNERLILGNINIKRDWGWAPEYVEAMWLMLQQERPEDFVIASGVTSSLEDFLRIAFSALGLDWNDHVDINTDLFRPSEIFIGKGNPLKAKQKLGWVAKYGLSDIIDEMIKDEKKSGND